MAYVISLMFLVISTVWAGFYFSKNPEKARLFAKKVFAGNIALFVAILVFAVIGLFPTNVFAEGTTQAAVTDTNNNLGLGLVGAALATGLAAIGAGVGVGMVGAASVGAISEKPELLGKTLIYVGLAEGIAIYGLIVTIMILGRI
ncbi:F0F1-type ATP synthase, subunit c/archaeal/vacuolar-type H+-ATPase, subunit K [Marinitoga piezophila KA3]|uniref:ATP synthase F(0) sector subunit c n=1 Tax=Marinitoga piezophila (strain DSM 14283 / JCM 11233 / KA3) TaxID=443254 RepID=H2J5M0_MARPK|nr:MULTISPECIES: ATP synthase subunit C [Marinitoga]AEX85006.1 F0F1-type ATP synthase, subunit c/archaeal/vacuolar-type H+-ATPase, subunit K [Marinitoga piezophila KA3]APT75510.1 ATPase [Marinitoga sp. 1137]